MGMLRISGTISLNQFWPRGAVGRNLGSDADTIKVVIDKSRVLHNSTPTTILNTAYAIDKGKKKPVIHSSGEIEVRLQGVDAPELHFPSSVKREDAAKPNGDFRQAWGETATKALAAFLKKKFGNGPLRCEVVSQNIDKPSDICDSHGRLVGNVVINGTDINLWLLHNGWAFPTFYDGMLKDEIEEATALAKRAFADKKNIWKDYQAVAFFDPGVVFNRSDSLVSDKGPVLLPKLFRRSAVSFVTQGSLKKLLTDIRGGTKDRFVRTSDFLKGNKTFQQWGKPTTGVVREAAGGKVKMALKPWEFVLKEEPSKLFHVVAGKQIEVTSF